jgi:hypothetical protein
MDVHTIQARLSVLACLIDHTLDRRDRRAFHLHCQERERQRARLRLALEREIQIGEPA